MLKVGTEACGGGIVTEAKGGGIGMFSVLNSGTVGCACVHH